MESITEKRLNTCGACEKIVEDGKVCKLFLSAIKEAQICYPDDEEKQHTIIEHQYAACHALADMINLLHPESVKMLCRY